MDIRSEIEAEDLEDDLSTTLGQNENSNEQEETEVQQGKSRKYRFRMRYFFYIHLSIFIVSGLFGGLTIYLIENYSAVKNRQLEVSFIDAWFVSCTCMCGCGLTTVNFARLSKTSQILLLVLTILFGFTLSTLPILVIKAYIHKHAKITTVDNDPGRKVRNSEENRQSSTSRRTIQRLPSELESKFVLLPTSHQIRYWAYIIIVVLILLTCAVIYISYFIILGAWLDARYSGNGLAEGNITINPWYASIIIVITGFNQNGLTPFSDGMARFVNDVFVNIFVMMVILSGASLFPSLLRNIIIVSRRLAPWRYKIVFDYILLNHHHLSTLLFPTLQTRIYLFITFLLYLMAVLISIILDIHNSYFSQFSSTTRLLIFVFHAVSARFAGFQTIDISRFTIATLFMYLLLMATKPQMLCALSKSRFELIWISLRGTPKGRERQQDAPLLDPMGNVPLLRRQTSSAVASEISSPHQTNFHLISQYFAAKELTSKTRNSGDDEQNHSHVLRLHSQLLLFRFGQAIFKHTRYTLGRTRTWLFIFIFLICAIEHERIAIDSNITIFKIIFEIISAFGCVGLSLGYPGVSSSFSTILSPSSKVIVGLTMLLGRHRGLLASMKDQEGIEHDANDLVEKLKEKAIHQYKESVRDKVIITRF